MNDPEPRAPDYRWTILGITLLAVTATGAVTQAVPTLVPFLRADLGLSRAEIGLLNSASAFGLMASLMAAGWLVDVIGSRRIMLAGLLTMGCILATFGLSRSFPDAMILLLLAGAANGVSSPAISKPVIVWFPAHERGFAMGIQRTGIPLMGALAAAILPGVAVALGWRAAIVGLAATVLASALIVVALFRESPTPMAGGMARARPGSPWKLLRNRNILFASVLPSVMVGVQFCLVNYLVLYLAETLATPVVVASGALAVTQLGGVFGRLFWGMVSDRVFRGGRRDVLLLIGALSSLLLAALGFLPAGVPLWGVTLLAATLGVLALGWHAVYTIFLPEISGKELAGSAVGVGYTLMQVGSIVVPPLFGYVVDVTGDYRWGWTALALLSASGTSLLLLVRETRRSGGARRSSDG